MNKRTLAIVFMCIFSVLLAFLSLSVITHSPYKLFFANENLTNNTEVPPKKLFLNSWKIVKKRYFDATLNHQDWDKWKDRYIDKIETEDDAYLAINTMLASLDDPYSRFLNAEEYSEQTTNINSKIIGIGVNITSISGKMVVVSSIDGTPAQKAGLQGGDILLKVDGKDVHGKNIAEVAQMIRGEEGLPVTLELMRNGKKFTKTLIREQIKIKSVKHKVLPKDIGYIQVSSFLGATVGEDFLEAMRILQGTRGLIIDLRGNTGGLLPNAIVIADIFLSEGNIVSIVDRNGIKNDINAQGKSVILQKPVVILVDGATASASEIFSGALKDYHKAILVGEKTFGKGLVQKIYPMPNQTGMNLTIAKYLTPNGSDINKKGIVPDYIVKYTEQDYYANRDPQLEEAQKIIVAMD